MSSNKRPVAFWGLCVFLSVSLIFLLVGQTSAIFAYDFAVSLGLQESVEDVTEYGVQVNRAFGVGDTVVYIPLVVAAMIGIVRRRRWALPITGAVMGISVYWATTCLAMFGFLPGTPGYNLQLNFAYWVVLGSFIGIGVWGIVYLSVRGERLVGGT